MKVIISCSGKFHAFSLAEQLQKNNKLVHFFTLYAWQKNRIIRRLVGRIDKEMIDSSLISTFLVLAFLKKIAKWEYLINDFFDKWVSFRIKRIKEYDVFIGWSGMSYHSILSAKRNGKITILERGSSHILFQNEILKEEYSKFGLDFAIDPRVIQKELCEYEACDYISVPSIFVLNTFLQNGIDPNKLIVNPYGASNIFRPTNTDNETEVFRILYLGSLTRRKGVVYLLSALKKLSIPVDNFEVWFIGSISDELKGEIELYKEANWQFWGHISQLDLPDMITKCDVAIQPSIEEGLSMVIPQMLACGVPVIATTNTGGENIIKDGETGFIIPIRSPDAIADKIQFLYENPNILKLMKTKAADSVKSGFTWDDYGQRYVQFLNQLTLPSKV